MVLGVQWLRTLESILWDFEHARMCCWHDDHRVQTPIEVGFQVLWAL
jgi:hypothetical protein